MAKTFADFDIDVPPWKHGRTKVQCPQCQHTRSREHRNDRPLSVQVEQGVWRCHHCGWRGGLGLADGDWREHLSVPRTYTKPEPPPEASALDERAVAFFTGRGIPQAIAASFGVYSTTAFCPQSGKEERAIAFPYHRIDPETGERAHVNTKYRFPGKHFKMEQGAELTFYNLDGVEDATDLIIVEGEGDVLALAVAGYGGETLSVPNGGGVTSLPFLNDPAFRKVLAQVASVTLAVDMDETGRKIEENLARTIDHKRIKRVQWPEGCKDANDTLMQHGVAGIKQALGSATYYPRAGSVHFSDLRQHLYDAYHYAPTRGFSTGWESLDEFYTVRPGELTVVTGVPSDGKSAFIASLLVNLVREHNFSFSVLSPENCDDTPEPVAEELITRWVGKPFKQGYSGRMVWEEVDATIDIFEDHFAFIHPEEPALDEVLATADIHLAEIGIKGLVIDPWNEITHDRKGLTETDYIGEALRRIRQFARKRQIHVWIIAHPTKMPKLTQVDGTQRFEVPNPYSISGSAHWFNKPDNCLTVYRLDDTTQIHVQKIRKQPGVGKKGVAEFVYDWRTGVYAPLAPKGSFISVA